MSMVYIRWHLNIQGFCSIWSLQIIKQLKNNGKKTTIRRYQLNNNIFKQFNLRETNQEIFTPSRIGDVANFWTLWHKLQIISPWKKTVNGWLNGILITQIVSKILDRFSCYIHKFVFRIIYGIFHHRLPLRFINPLVSTNQGTKHN